MIFKIVHLTKLEIFCTTDNFYEYTIKPANKTNKLFFIKRTAKQTNETKHDMWYLLDEKDTSTFPPIWNSREGNDVQFPGVSDDDTFQKTTKCKLFVLFSVS